MLNTVGNSIRQKFLEIGENTTVKKNTKTQENDLITISPVNKRQKKILDHLWSIETLEDLEDWKSTLNPKLKNEVSLLEELIILSYLDEISDDHDFSEIDAMISKCRK